MNNDNGYEMSQQLRVSEALVEYEYECGDMLLIDHDDEGSYFIATYPDGSRYKVSVERVK